MNSLESPYKIRHPNRSQIQFQTGTLDDLIPKDHRARDVWNFVQELDCSSCYYEIKSYKRSGGRSTASPKVLLALWIYSIIDGNSSARKLDELCHNHNAYKWLAGDVPINRNSLAEFRSRDPIVFEDLLTSCLAAMVKHELIDDLEFSQDGTRVKANAGFNTFKRQSTLESLKAEMKSYIRKLDLEAKTENNAYEKKQKIKEQKRAKDKMERLDLALKELKNTQAEKTINGARHRQEPSVEELNKVRASYTDPTARKMKMGDGGFRLAYNV